MYVCMYICMYVCMYICMCMCGCIHAYVLIFVCVIGPPSHLCQGRRVHAKVNRELNLTSLVSPQEKLPPSCDTMVLEQGRLW